MRVDDPSFASALERAYLAGLEGMEADPEVSMLELHSRLMDAAVFKADPGRGGIRLRALRGRQELDARLLEALRRALSRR